MKQERSMREVTIYDIAKLAGVSASTVSRVINGKSTVKKSTRDRVLKILAENHYVPNETARGLVTQSTHMIGILITDVRTTQHTDGIYYIQRELAENGYSCLIYNTGRNENDWIRYIQMLVQRKVDAAILMGSIYQTEKVKNAIETYLPSTPVVLCNGYMDAQNIYCVMADEQNGVAQCVSLLAGKGRKKIAFLLNQVTPSNLLKQEGYLTGINRFCPGTAPIVRETGNTVREIYDAAVQLLDEIPDLDGIIFSEDRLALIGLRALADRGREVPKDISVIGINNSEYAEISIPTLTSLDNVLYDLSMNAVRNVLTLLEGKRVSKKMIIGTEIVERQST